MEVNGKKSTLNRVKFLERILDSFLQRAAKGEVALDNLYAGYHKLIENQIKFEPNTVQESQEMLEILKKVYTMFKNEEFREIITTNHITSKRFLAKYGEKILGDNKRNYDMSRLFNEKLISSKGKESSERLVQYIEKEGKAHHFQDDENKEVILQRIGELVFLDAFGVHSNISKYKVGRQINKDDYLVKEIFSNISIINMDNPEYKQAVLDELLSRNNIQLSNVGGYVGEIILASNGEKNLEIGNETVSAGNYLYRINEKYTLAYDKTDLSAVMIDDKKRKRQKEAPNNPGATGEER